MHADRDSLKLAQQEFEFVPLPILGTVFVAVVLSLWGKQSSHICRRTCLNTERLSHRPLTYAHASGTYTKAGKLKQISALAGQE